MDRARIQVVLERIAGTPLLVVGDAMLDRYVYGSTDRVSREAPVPVVQYEREESRLGGAGNAARNAVALGGQVALATVIGDDDGGRGLREALRQAGVAERALVDERGRVTQTKLRVLAGSPGTSKQQVLRLDREAQQPPTADSYGALLDAVDRELGSCQAALVSDYGGGSVGDAVVARLAKVAARLPVVVDSRYRLAHFCGPFVLKPNAPELGEATGLPTRDAAQVEVAARALLARTGARAVLCTRGRDGMLLVRDQGPTVAIRIFGSDDVADVTGAGDTVAAAVALALGAGANDADALALATVASGLVVQKLGAATATPTEILAAVDGELA